MPDLKHILLLTAVVAIVASAQAPADKLTVDLQAAIQKESVQGDLKAAIAMYEKLAARASASSNRDIATRALLRLGQCQEKLGNTEARKAYERIVREFGDQPGAAEARTRLAALAGPAAVTPKVVYSASDIDAPRPNRDGRFVAAFCKQALCLFDVVTGARTDIVPATGNRHERHWRPLPSPDGQSLAYVHFSDRNGDSFAELRVRRSQGGQDTVLASGLKDTFSPVDWTADGKSVLFARIDPAGVAGLFLIPASGGATAQTVHAPGFNWSAGRDNSKISPDGKWLAYPVSGAVKQGGGYVPTDVAVISMAGGQPTIVLDGAGHERVLGWLASGDLVATSDRTGKVVPYRIRIDARGNRQGDPQAMATDLGEGSTIAGVSMATGSLFISTGTRETKLHAFSPDLNSSKPFPTGYQAATPAFSPDGRKFAYASGGTTNFVVVRDLATGAEQRLPGDIPRILNLGWYPDSRHLFAITNEGNWQTRHAFRFDITSNELKPLPNVVGMSAYFNPAILADGKTLLFAGREDGNDDGVIVALDTETGASRILVKAQAPYTGIGSFSLSPDRRRLVYLQYNRVNKSSALTVADIDAPGKSQTVYTCDKPDCSAMVAFFTPDQKSLLFWRGPANAPDQASLARLTLGSSEPPVILKKHPFTPDGPAFHPVTGEIILGTYTYRSELRIK